MKTAIKVLLISILGLLLLGSLISSTPKNATIAPLHAAPTRLIRDEMPEWVVYIIPRNNVDYEGADGRRAEHTAKCGQ